MKTLPIKTNFRAPKNPTEAIQQANIVERAETLLTDGGYRMEEEFGGGGIIFRVIAPDGHFHTVCTVFENCTCPSFEQHEDCKHRIAVALEQAREAAQVAALEAENGWWQESGFDAPPLYI